MAPRHFSTQVGRGGTRFRLYAQPPVLAAFRDPITVELSPPARSLGVGPHDDRMCVIQPLDKPESYGDLLVRMRDGRPTLPPWRGAVAKPARPGPDGSFDHLHPQDPTFAQAHAFACVRLALDVWEGYLGGPLPWHFASGPRWLEIGLLGPGYDNGEVGWGWLELGYDRAVDRARQPYALNLDVIAHEVGHLIVYSVLGQPGRSALGAEYLGFQETAADLVALLAAAHLDPVVDQVMARTRGNLYVANELSRLGEMSSTAQIRIASNSTRMSEFVHGWSAEHDLSEPLTGAMFDLLLDIFQANLLERRLIPRSLADLIDEAGHLRAFAPVIQAEFDHWYPRAPAEFKDAFAAARDRLGAYFADVLTILRQGSITFVAVRDALAAADRRWGGAFGPAIAANFRWRQIGMLEIGPFLGSRRLLDAGLRFGLHRCAKREMGAFSNQQRVSA